MRQFGLIGYPLSHSFSKGYFTEKFKKEGLTDCIYDIYPIAFIGELPAILQQHPLLEGLNVTIPYKEKVLAFVDVQQEAVKAIGACNCIKIIEGKLHAYNTDTIGFETALKKYWKPHHNKALILGTGGAAKAVAYSLRQMNIDFRYVSRQTGSSHALPYHALDKETMEAHTLIINTTPLGMYPDVDSAPDIPYQWISSEHYLFDLTYNPAKTLFLQKGEAQGAVIQNGYDMLIIQAEESWKIWNQ